jgi:outer membrane protein assembly factor BamA
MEKSRENLMNTSLFNFVNVESKSVEENPASVDIIFSFTERWYIWPWPILEFADRNFNTWWTENRDLSRLSYGVALRWENFRGRKETLELNLKFGYNEQYGLNYTIPYLNKKETLGLSFGASYGRTREVPVINLNNELIYYKDEDLYVMDMVKSHVSLIYRREIYNTQTFRLEYNFMNFADTLLEINPGFSVDNKNKLQYLSLAYRYRSDHRDLKAYPLQGYYFELEVVKRGLGILDNGNLDVFYVQTTFRRYLQLGKRWYFASGLNSKFSNDPVQPFYMERAIGYGRDIVRGYEYYVVNGQNFGIFKNNLKFALLPTRQFQIKCIKSEKFSKVHYAFYLNAFLDMGFAYNFYSRQELNNDLENHFLLGYGLGLDFVTYYDIVWRIEYSFNRMNEHGFFLHFTAPI